MSSGFSESSGIVGATGGVGDCCLLSFLGLVKDLTGSYSTGLFVLASDAFATVVALHALQLRPAACHPPTLLR